MVTAPRLKKALDKAGSVNLSLPLKDRINLRRLRRALDKPLFMDQLVCTVQSLTHKCQVSRKLLAAEPCGTIGCIAGNVVLKLMPKKTSPGEAYEQGSTTHLAARLLGLTRIEGEELFYIGYPDKTVGTRAYNREVKKMVNGWLKMHGVKETV